jgi:hypothetical protein
VVFAVPQVLQAGLAQRVTVYGHRLPGGKSSQVLGADGEPLEQRELEITAATAPTEPSAMVGVLGQPPSTPLAGESWLWRGSDGVVPVQSVPFALTTLPVVAGASTGLVSVTLPCEFSALFPARGHSSGVSFEAKKGDVFWLELTSERWGYSVDPMALVQRAKIPAASTEALAWVDVLELADTVIGSFPRLIGTPRPAGRCLRPVSIEFSFAMGFDGVMAPHNIPTASAFAGKLPISTWWPSRCRWPVWVRIVALRCFRRFSGATRHRPSAWLRSVGMAFREILN